MAEIPLERFRLSQCDPWPWGRRLRPISGEPAALPAREGCREVCMLNLGRFVLGVGAEGN
jgi:hypothetical protein